MRGRRAIALTGGLRSAPRDSPVVPSLADLYSCAMRGVREQYERDGFAVLPGVISEDALSKLEAAICELATELSGRQIDELHSEQFADVVGSNRELESALYSRVRDYPWLLDFSCEPKLTAAVQAIARCDVGLFRHIPLRIDLPKVTRELAVWHHDHFYVKGNTEVVTAWVPLQDTSFIKGCLQVMPGSHKLGPIPARPSRSRQEVVSLHSLRQRDSLRRNEAWRCLAVPRLPPAFVELEPVGRD